MQWIFSVNVYYGRNFGNSHYYFIKTFVTNTCNCHNEYNTYRIFNKKVCMPAFKYAWDLNVHILVRKFKYNLKYLDMMNNMFGYEFSLIIVVKPTHNQVTSPWRVRVTSRVRLTWIRVD